MALKVIGAGLGRTGTLSLKTALEELGFTKCYHMLEAFKRPAHITVWDAAANGAAVDWEALFEGFQASVDWPGCNFYAEHLRLYPDAKVILTVRDPEKWYASCLETIFFVRNAFPGWMALVIPRFRHIRSMVDSVAWVGMFRGRFAEKAYAIEVFNRHNEDVRRVVPADRLLVYEVKEGWGPLCEFLGVAPPAGKPFPHLNDAKEFRARIQRVAAVARSIPYVLAGVAALILAWLVSRR